MKNKIEEESKVQGWLLNIMLIVKCPPLTPCSCNMQMVGRYVPRRQTSHIYLLLLFPYLLLVIIRWGRWGRYSKEA